MAGFSASLTTIGFLALATLISLNCAAAATTRTRDLDAMNQLKQAWMPSVKNLNWEGDPCTTPWTGVTCNTSTESNFVTEINLMNRNIQGTIPPSISGLTDLIELEMSQNSGLIGEIPEEIGRLENLQTLSLQYCGLTGPLPGEIGNLRRLSFLGLNGNQFNGSIPPEVGHTNLTWFDISQNNFSGQIPVSSNTRMGVGLDNLTYIEHYHMFNNYLSGHIPAELFNPQGLLHLLVNSNNLTGPLPNVTRFPPSLTVIRVDDNELVDNVPIGFENATFLTELNIRKNQFSGPLRNFSRLRGLNFLDLSENNFDPEPFPSWVLSLQDIVTLRLASLSLSGTVPPAIFNGDLIQAVDLSSNSLSGTLSFSGTTGEYLAEVNLHNNNISGVAGQPAPLHPEFVLSLQGNPICLNSLIAFKNTNSCGDPARLIWTHPNDSSNTCDSLCRKHMQFNKYMCSCSYPLELEILLTAPTFTDLTNATNGLEHDLAGNLGLEPNQTYITDMRINDQQQVIVRLSVFPIDPAKDVNLPDATRTRITTRIQQHLFVLPQGPFVLHDIILPDEHSSDKLSTAAIAGIVIGSLLGLLIVSGSIFSAIFYKRRADKAMSSNPFASWGGGSAEFGEAPKLKGARWFSLAELKTYTDNWSDYNQIGVGGYGRVYKGVLPTGDLVAIKRATEGSMQGANEFKNEIELLSRVHHRNLLSLIGFCYEGGEQALIYEFMSNGTLDDHLKGSKGDPLSWESRLAIALGSAKGIAYLHDHASPPIIHRDIKSPNILLNDRMVPKVADFGLSKLAPDEGDKLVQSVHVKGTLGYLDPEYYMTQILTDKSDVYSFGIVLLELLTSRPPIDMGKFVVREVRTALDKGGIDALRALLDPAIGNVSKAELEPYLAIALECVEENANLRPTISLVVKRLEALEMGEGVKAMDGRKVRYADEPIIINDAENAGLLKSRYSSSGAPERGQRQSDPFAYSGAYGVSATVKPK